MPKPRMEQKRLGFAKDLRDRVQETSEERDIGFHRAGRVEQGNESQRLDLAPAEFEVERFAAMSDAEPDRRAQVESPTAATRAFAKGEPRPHHPRETFGKLRGLGALPLADERRDILPRYRLLRRRPAAPAAALRWSALRRRRSADMGRILLLLARAGPMLKTSRRTSGERLGPDLHGALRASPAPEGVEQLVKPRDLRSA